jgi:hypothetical protein
MEIPQSEIDWHHLMHTISDDYAHLMEDFRDKGAQYVDENGWNIMMRYFMYSKDPDPLVIKNMIKSGIDAKQADFCGKETILWAVGNENTTPEVLQILLNAGADLNAKD